MGAAAVTALYAVPGRVGPEQHVPESLLVGHYGVATDDGVAALTLLRIRIETPLTWVELLHGARNIEEPTRQHNFKMSDARAGPNRAAFTHGPAVVRRRRAAQKQSEVAARYATTDQLSRPYEHVPTLG